MLRIIDSNVLEAIGLTYFSIVFGGFTSGTGIMFADILVSGIIPSRNELLNSAFDTVPHNRLLTTLKKL